MADLLSQRSAATPGFHGSSTPYISVARPVVSLVLENRYVYYQCSCADSLTNHVDRTVDWAKVTVTIILPLALPGKSTTRSAFVVTGRCWLLCFCCYSHVVSCTLRSLEQKRPTGLPSILSDQIETPRAVQVDRHGSCFSRGTDRSRAACIRYAEGYIIRPCFTT